MALLRNAFSALSRLRPLLIRSGVGSFSEKEY
jgi:hypothetical protein